MLPESGCFPALGFAGSMQTTQELSPRSAEQGPAVLGLPHGLGLSLGLGEAGPLTLAGGLLSLGAGEAGDSPPPPSTTASGAGEAVLRTLKGLSAMTVKQEEEDAEDLLPVALLPTQTPTPLPLPDPPTPSDHSLELADSPMRDHEAILNPGVAGAGAGSPAGAGAGAGSNPSHSTPPSPQVVYERQSPSTSTSNVEQLRQIHQQQLLQQQQQHQLKLQQIHRHIQEQQQKQQQRLKSEPARGGDTGRGRGRRRSRWKLKFHHQALPPEYLDHYEASLASQGQGNRGGSNRESRDSGDDKARVIGSRAPRNPDRKRPLPSAPTPTQSSGSSAAQGSEPSGALASGATQGMLNNLPLIAPKPANGGQASSQPTHSVDVPHNVDSAPSRPAFPTSVPIPVPMPFGLEVLTRYQALLGQGKTDVDPASFVAGNLMQIMNKDDRDKAANGASASADRESNRALLSNLLSSRIRGQQEQREDNQPRQMGKVMSYQDLPYMGEITLDNMKPRRGRKPKKADICHLIYKNYGTVFPKRDISVPHEDQPELQIPQSVRRSPNDVPVAPVTTLSRSDIQNRIISSLLEKRLTNTALEEANKLAQNGADTSKSSEEPLNLCMRDHHNPLKIKLMRKHGNFYESNGGVSAAAKSEPSSPESVFIEVDADPSLVNQEDDDEEMDEDREAPTPSSDTPSAMEDVFPPQSDLLYWPGAGGMFVHPLLYGKGFPMAVPQGLPTALPVSTMGALPHLSQLSQLQVVPSLPPLPPLLRLPGLEDPTVADESNARGRPIQDDRLASRPSPPTRSARGSGSSRTSSSQRAAPSPPKRKRSAIFIPPVPSESNSNPTTEVSICKFKFTGGAKPSLQEKKMLSVDAGGNFRYYSGTGDKSMRGYEFFPRETMQLQQTQKEPQQQHLPRPTLPTAQQSHQSENLRNLLFQNVMDSLQMQVQGVAGAGVGGDVGLDLLAAGFPQPASTASGPSLTGAGAPQRDQALNRGYLPQTSSASMPSQWDSDANFNMRDRRTTPSHRTSSLGQYSLGHGEMGIAASSKKRKTRKSLEREKLEKTFKEKGFLIQTQQLESAEGATYCKFRQLRKFTRYLFRSWKDYLPGNVKDMSIGTAGAPPSTSSAPAPDGPGPPSSTGTGTGQAESLAMAAFDLEPNVDVAGTVQEQDTSSVVPSSVIPSDNETLEDNDSASKG